MRERRAHYEASPVFVNELLLAGTEKVRAETQETVRLALDAMGLSVTLRRMRLKVERQRRRGQRQGSTMRRSKTGAREDVMYVLSEPGASADR